MVGTMAETVADWKEHSRVVVKAVHLVEKWVDEMALQ